MSTKNQILDSALLLFTENGVHATSVSAIRLKAEVSNGSFFHAFSSKEELVSELYLRSLSDYHEKIIDSISEKPGAKEGIRLMIQAHISWVVQEKKQALFLFEQSQINWAPSMQLRHNEINKQFQQAIAEWASPLTENKQLMSLPPNILGAQLIGPTQVICRAWLSGRSSDNPKDSEEHLILITQKALLTS